MNVEEMFKQILDGQDEIKTEIKGVKIRLDGVETEIKGIKVRLDKVEAGMAEMKEDIKDLQQKTDVLLANSNRTGEYVEYLSKELIAADIIHEQF